MSGDAGDRRPEIGARIRVRGQVQGVGFRPFVWTAARELGLSGCVLNDASGVLIDVAGDPDALLHRLHNAAPPLARIDSVEVERGVVIAPCDGFRIAASAGGAADTRVTPDAATCAGCLAEIADPADRRHRHPFANCTHCGPRFSILTGLPYDRATTSMAAFDMCADCAAEYGDPADRRFHAQPVACPACGPRAWVEAHGKEAPGDPVVAAAALLTAGEILAIKGLGGVHLACDGTNATAIATLRARKHRPGKPLALMAPLDMIRAHAQITPEEERLLSDPAAPIVLLPRDGRPLPDAIAPGLDTFGWILPYTPLHHLLLARLRRPLVMTSGNMSGEPQVTANAGALSRLAPFADAFLLHDREIVRRLDDGVERMICGAPLVLRRGRGRCPEPLALPEGFATAPPGLAWGGQMKGAFCLTQGGTALLSHHLGDLDGALNWVEYEAAAEDYAALFDHSAHWHACDLHPGYRPTQAAIARAQGEGLPLIEVQHHHAHMASAMVENGHARAAGPVAGIVLDGLGLGPDGTLWGGEVLLGDYEDFERIAWLAPVPLMGGDAANREPWRPLLAQLDAAGAADAADRLLAGKPRALLRRAALAGVNAPLSSSAGRLFDAVAAALGIAGEAQCYEGEAAMRLEALARRSAATLAPYPFATGADAGAIDPAPLWQALLEDMDAGTEPQDIAWRFHAGLAAAFAGRARRLVEEGRAVAVALSGGCLQNALLAERLVAELGDVPVYLHRRIPASDGGLAIGQAAVASARRLGASG